MTGPMSDWHRPLYVVSWKEAGEVLSGCDGVVAELSTSVSWNKFFVSSLFLPLSSSVEPFQPDQSLVTIMSSYMEGIDILYSTNTFHISSLVLMSHLPSLVLPQHLAMITSLQLNFEVSLFIDHIMNPDRDQEKGWPPFTAMASVLGSSFPSLHKAYISLWDSQPRVYSRGPHESEVEAFEKALTKIDEAMQKLGPQLRELDVAVMYTIFEGIAAKASQSGAYFEPNAVWPPGRWFWRPVEVHDADKPGPDGSLGYWVRQGRPDVTYTSSGQFLRDVSCF